MSRCADLTPLPAIGTRVRDTRRPAFAGDNRGEGVVVDSRPTGAEGGTVKVRWDNRTSGHYRHTWVSPKHLEEVGT